MNVVDLEPKTEGCVEFDWEKFLSAPEAAGCYVLTNFSGEIFYIGQSENLRARLRQHLDDPEKRQKTSKGAVSYFHYRLWNKDLSSLERGWMNEYKMRHGKRPPFNKQDA